MEFAFKNMERSESIELAAKKVIEKALSKTTLRATSISTTFSINNRRQSVHVSAHLNDGYQIDLEHGENDIYKAIELIRFKLERDLRKHKNRKLSKRKRSEDKRDFFPEPPLAWEA